MTKGVLRTFLLAWLVLLLLVGVTLVGAYQPLGRLGIVLSLGIAVVKSAIVLAVFMKLPQGPPLARLYAAAGVFWLLIMFGLASADYLTRAGFPPH
jgi:cytochrome c oxidase subunit 4